MDTCSAEGCNRPADYRVMLYDFYTHNGELFIEQDHTCPFICSGHASENELKARGEREPRGMTEYPFTNQHGAQGFTIYLPMEKI
jgi:hypothetical protein